MKISVKNTEKLNTILEQVQEKSHTRIFTAEKIQCEAECAESELKPLGLPKNLLSGAYYRVGHESFPNAYKYIPHGTIIVLTRGASGWYLTYCSRDICNRSGSNGLRLTDSQREYLKSKIDKNYA